MAPRAGSASRPVRNGVDIAASAPEVFDLVADVRNEPRWNPHLLSVEKLTPGEPGVGTRYRVVFGRGVGETVIEQTAYERPRSWSAVSTSRLLDVEAEGSVTDTDRGCRLQLSTRLRPRGPLRVLTPALGWWMHRTWERDLAAVKRVAEGGEQPAPVEPTFSTGARVPGPRRTPEVPITRVPVPDLCALWAESTTTPMHIALMGVLDRSPARGADGGVDLDALRAHIEARLDRAPLLRRTLRPTRFGEGTPVWVDAPAFDIAAHVGVVDPPGPTLLDEDGFFAWCADRSMIPLDRGRPLWRLELVPGLPGGRTGMLFVLHHVVADGMRGVELVRRLLDDAPQPPSAASRRGAPAPQPTSRDLVLDNVRRRWDGLRGVRPAGVRRAAELMRALAHEPARRAPRTSLTGAIGHRRSVAVLEAPLERVRTAAHAHGATVNDLLLAAVTGGLREVLLGRGECEDGLVLLASVPVGARRGEDTGMFIGRLPVGVANPHERLRLIAEATRAGKAHPDEGVAGIVALPALLARLGVAWARRAAASRINLYVTNVPGPAGPLYLAGSRLIRVAPLAPLVAGVRLSVTALSYDGALLVSLLADEHLPDLPVLAEGVRAVLDGERVV